MSDFWYYFTLIIVIVIGAEVCRRLIFRYYDKHNLDRKTGKKKED